MSHVLTLTLLLSACSQKEKEPPPKQEEKPKAEAPKNATDLQFKVPGDWKSRPVTSKLRLMQFTVPDKKNTAKNAELVIFYFGPQGGGGVEANIDRWIGQFEGATRESAKIDKIKGAFEITLVDLSGTYVAETQPGSGEFVNEPDSRMLAAVLDTPKGFHYFKLIGPAATVSGWVEEFRALVKEAHFPP